MPTPSLARLAAAMLAVLSAATCLAKPTSHLRSPTIAFDANGRQVRVAITLDRSLIAARGDHEVKVLGTRGRFALLVDSYQSKPQGLSRCQSGEERYVRLVDLGRSRERYARLAESCLTNILPGDPIANWNPNGQAFTINLLSEPSIRIKLELDGKITSRSLERAK